MIRPSSEIEYPATQALRNRASMLARLEELNRSSKALMSVIAQRLRAEEVEDKTGVGELTVEQERLIDNMRALVRR